jgi:hypothetical protein
LKIFIIPKQNYMRGTLFLFLFFCCVSTTTQAQIGSKSIVLKPINLTDTLLRWKRQNLSILNPNVEHMVIDRSKHHFGVNFTHGLRTLLLLKETKPVPGSGDAYVFFYKYCFQNLGIRAAYGFNHISDIEDRGAGIIDDVVFNMDAKVGLEYRYQINSRWHYTFGVDGLYFSHGDRAISTTDFDVVTTENSYKGYGVAPFLGIQLNLNHRLALVTEAGYNFLFGNDHISSYFRNKTDKDTDKKKTRNENRYNGPLAVFLVLRF